MAIEKTMIPNQNLAVDANKDGFTILPVQGKSHAPVRLFANQRLFPGPTELDGLARVAALKHVVQVAALPDLHVKPHLETPSSTATATRDAVALSLSSPSPGCGMALALTPFGESDLKPERIDQFLRFLIGMLPNRYENRLPLVQDIRPFLMEGAARAVDHFNLDPQLLSSVERGGNAFSALPHDWPVDTALEAIPDMFLPLAAWEFGAVGRGNHFLEIQVVEEILDPQTASAWKIRPEQVVVMYHADSGKLGAVVGRFYAFRKKNTWRGRWLEARYKTSFHLAQSTSLSDFARRAGYYFFPRRHTLIPAGAPQARAALIALAAASNYAYANRVAILAAVRDGLQAVWGPGQEGPVLLYDVSHNGIQQEIIEDQTLWVHRHNASRALPAGHPDLVDTPFAATGQPLLLPGTNRSSSYLCRAGMAAECSLYSVDHGAGRTTARMAQALPDGGHQTRLYGYEEGFAGKLPHLSDDGLVTVVDVLSKSNLASPVARLRPVATLKDLSR